MEIFKFGLKLLLSTVAFSITACGRGASGESSMSSSTIAKDKTPILSGTLYYQNKANWYVGHSLDTSEISPIVQGMTSWQVSAGPDSKKFLFLQGGRRDVTMLNARGETITNYSLPDTVYGTPRLSPNQKYFAIGYAPDTTYLRVYDVDGKLIRSIKEPERKGSFVDGSINSWAWTPNGSLLIAAFNQVFILNDIVSGTPVSLATFKDPDIHVGNMTVSPGGTMVALTLGTSDAMHSGGDISILSIDGKRLTKLTHSVIPQRNLTWSPDGKYVGFVYGSGNSTPLGVCPHIWIVPANSSVVADLDAQDKSPAFRPTYHSEVLCANTGVDWR